MTFKRRPPLFSLITIIIALTLMTCKGSLPGEGGGGGAIWKVFTSANSPLLNNNIRAITIDFEGKVWFGTDSGASSFIRGSWGRIKDSLYSQGPFTIIHVVNSIVQSKDGSLWFALPSGLVRFNQFPSGSQNVWTRFTPDNGLPFADVASVTADRSTNQSLGGGLWGGTGIGIIYLDLTPANPTAWQFYLPTDKSGGAISTNEINVVATDPFDNSIWFGAQSDGLLWYSTTNNSWSTTAPPAFVRNYAVNSIAFDQSGRVWIGQDVGASSYDPNAPTQWKHYSPDTTPNGSVYAVLTSGQKTRWFGTDSGLVKLDDTTWSRFSTANSPLPDNKVTTLKLDLQGNLWIGTSNGAAVYNPSGTGL